MQPAADNRDLVAIGASAGGVQALTFLASRLPGNLPAAVLVTLHLPPQFPSSLDAILSRAGPLKAEFGTTGTAIERGRIYIAPPDHHLLAEDGHLALGVGPRENYSRPAIDPMFRSVALCCGSRSVAVVLTGTMGDGASGLRAVKEAGGLTVVQDPRDAAYSDMPSRALERAEVDEIVRLEDIAEVLSRMVQGAAGEGRPASDLLRQEVAIARTGRSSIELMDRMGRRSVLTCPDCGGVMWEIDDGNLVRYRCHVGHAYHAELMDVALDESLRRALGTALRSLEERAGVARKLWAEAQKHERDSLAGRWRQQAMELEREAETIRDSIRRIEAISSESTTPRR